MLKSLRDDDPNLLLVSAGGFYSKPGIIEMYRSRFLSTMMIRMEYTAVAVGARELNYGLRAITADIDEGLPAICSNLYRGGKRVFSPYHVRKINGWTVGIFALLDKIPADADGLDLEDAGLEGSSIIGELVQKGCDLVILLAHMRKSNLISVLPDLEGVDLIVRGNAAVDGTVPDNCADTLGGAFDDLGIPVLYAGDRGRAVGKVVIGAGPDGGAVMLESRLIHLDRGIIADEEYAAFFKEFVKQEGVRVREVRLSEFFARDKITGRVRERFIGMDVCRRCHADLFPAFLTSRHFRAFEILTIRNETNNPKCLACHATGYGQFTGYDPEKEKQGDIYLRGVQCEACHGQGTMHARNGSFAASAIESCRRCHTSHRSPDFDYGTYWKRAGHCTVSDSTVYKNWGAGVDGAVHDERDPGVKGH